MYPFSRHKVPILGWDQINHPAMSLKASITQFSLCVFKVMLLCPVDEPHQKTNVSIC